MSRRPKYDEEIVRLRSEGKTFKQIETIVGVSRDTVRASLRRNGFNPEPSGLKTEGDVRELVNSKQPDWEYVDGYTGCDGRLNLRHKTCGNIYNMSCVSTRHGKHLKCEYCDEVEREHKKIERRIEQSRIAKIVKRFNRPAPKGEQLQMKTCPDCGAFYFGRGATCAECSVKRSKRIANRKKELKRKNSYTRESKMISARTLYERDGGVCWICGGMCDINADPNSNYYPSVDHIVPQSLGGKDTLDNVRLAHRICNTVRLTNQNIEEVRSYLIPSG